MSKQLAINHRTKYQCSFDGMCWPMAHTSVGDIGWRLRYPDLCGGDIDRSDAMLAAEIIEAYRALVWADRQHREHVIRHIRQASREAFAELPEDEK